MSFLFAWLPSDPASRDARGVLGRMERALRVRPEERASFWPMDGFGFGVLLSHPCASHEPTPRDASEIVVIGGRHYFWAVGEIYHGGKVLDITGPDSLKAPGTREALFDALLSRGFDDVSTLDGEYVLVHWDAETRTLQLVNDRFGGLPLYWGQSNEGVAVAGGVRGVLAAPGIEADADEDALREAVTFGGFRLGDRTNVRSVKMFPGGTHVAIQGGAVRQRRYWTYQDIPSVETPSEDALVERASTLWERAIARRLDRCPRPGQTLSGGLDSRAILAEAAGRTPRWSALTYGVRGCDDARFGKRAAEAAGAAWQFYDLYEDPDDWLEARGSHIQGTDGLVALGDLMHVETVRTQARAMDVHYSGYIGDVVCGPTYSTIEHVEDLYAQLPYYGTGLGMNEAAAHERLLTLVDALRGAPLSFAVFEHKLPQSTNRWATAWRPWIKVRKPFLDYELFDFWQGLPVAVRCEQNAYERFLLHRYPRFFERIPNQKTGVPILTPEWRRQLVRVGRYGLRRLARTVGRPGSIRSYHDDHTHIVRMEFRARIEESILRSDSLSCEILGRESVASLLADWFERAAAPEQIVGALYVFEAYHRDLTDHLRQAARADAS